MRAAAVTGGGRGGPTDERKSRISGRKDFNARAERIVLARKVWPRRILHVCTVLLLQPPPVIYIYIFFFNVCSRRCVLLLLLLLLYRANVFFSVILLSGPRWQPSTPHHGGDSTRGKINVYRSFVSQYYNVPTYCDIIFEFIIWKCPNINNSLKS